MTQHWTRTHFAGYACEFSPFREDLLAVSTAQYYGIVGNGKQQILPGGFTHLLDHKNWRFEKFMTLKIQTDDLEKIEATSADNITMKVTSTVTWRIVNPTLAAITAAKISKALGAFAR